MGTIQKDSVGRNLLKNLCCSYGWSYGVFWSYDQPNSLLLTLQDSYFDEKIVGLIDNLLLQVPLGGGIIGQAAYTNKHLWMSSEDHYREQNSSGSILDMFLDDSEFRCQFSSGMKTIAVIPVEPQGVVQFGSVEEILERAEFVNETKRMFQEIVNLGGTEICHQNEVFSSLISSKESCFIGFDQNLVGPTSSSALFDAHPDFGIPDEFFPTENFDASQWFTPKNDLLFTSVNSDDTVNSLTISGTDWGDILMSVMDESHSGFQSYGSECLTMSKSTQHVDHTTLGPKERLFSKLGIEELLEGASGISHAASTSCNEVQVSSAAKRRKTGNLTWEMSSLQPVVFNNNLDPKKEFIPKTKPGLGTLNGYSVSSSSTIVQAKKQVELPKPTKKKAKPGTRPRPKDRQQILDRMAELRQLIPNGEKMSIDCLLDRTIKHMLFLECVTKQADRIKQVDQPKHNGVVSNDPSTNGMTWACELGNETMVCPLMVEDLSTPGQILIEMLCEEQGFFLEIVDIIRGFGLIILKGVMENRVDKIWARFIVETEVNRNVTRHDIFSALVGILQTTSFSNSGVQNLVNLGEMQYCVNS